MGYGKKSKNSPTGIRTPVFHVTGEDTNQLYYWRLLNKGRIRVDEAADGEGDRKRKGREERKRKDERYPGHAGIIWRPVRVGLRVG